MESKRTQKKLDNINDIIPLVEREFNNTPVIDIHTHIFPACFGDLLLWGIDELLTYHYLVAETMRWVEMDYKHFWSLDKKAQADLIWDTLFIKNTPISESCRGVLTVLNKFGLDTSCRDLSVFRDSFNRLEKESYIDIVFELSGVKQVIMTNNPFNKDERKVWQSGYKKDKRFMPALRIDQLLNSYDSIKPDLKKLGYDVDEFHPGTRKKTLKEITRFISDWIEIMQPVYLAMSLPPTFNMPVNSSSGLIIEECILPLAADKNIPLSMMIGAKRSVNPLLRDAGDSIGKADISAIEYLCSSYPHNKFLVTMLSLENQHELCITARKFRNLYVFGCWWFLNNPSLINEITEMRLELLGFSFIPQHSDARVIDQLIYKWDHSRRIMCDVLIRQYDALLKTGWGLNVDDIKRDVSKMLNNNLNSFLDMKF